MYFIVSKKKLITVCLIAGFFGIAIGSFLVLSSYADTLKSRPLSVIVDAGHGLPDGGAVGTGGTVEQEINLKIAEKLSEVLSAKGIKVVMTRTDENGIWDKDSDTIRKKKLSDMHRRRRIMEESDSQLFLSIHMNSFPNKSTSGLRIFYSPKFPEIKELAENIQVRMSDVTGASMSVIKTVDSSLYLMKNPPLASILIECGFLSNPKEEKLLSEDDYQARLAWAIADAVEKYYLMN